ncbi:MAG: AAA family ATPase [Acidobacteriota bacterium]
MRPRSLSIENFTCFRGPQPPIELDSLSLFAITGATGAGKSSVLDAMIYALYGRAPRLGAKNLDQLIALGREELVVTLDFDVAGASYRVTRRNHRKRATLAQLERLGSDEPALANGPRDVDTAVRKLLGIDYDAFTRAVVLPQGRFADFLAARPNERREILRELLRLEIYEVMRGLATTAANELGREIRQLRDRLDQDYADARRATLEERRTELETTRAQVTQTEKTLDTERRQLELEQDVRALQTRKATLLASRAELDDEATEIDNLRARVQRADRATPLIAELRTLTDTAERHARLTTDLANARERLKASHERVEAARQHASRFDDESARRAELDRLRHLDEVVGLLTPHGEAAKRVDKLEGSLRALTDTRKRVEAERAAADTTLERARAHLLELTEAVATSGYQPEVDELLDLHREEAGTLVAQRQQLGEMWRQAHQARETANTSGAEAKRRETAAKKSRDRLHGTRARLENLRVARRQEEERNTVALLRRDLVVGDGCPVCEQIVDRLPLPTPLTALETIDEEITRVIELEDEQRLTMLADERAAATTRGHAQSDESVATETHQAASLREWELDRARQTLYRELAQAVASTEDTPPSDPLDGFEQRLLDAARTLAERRVVFRAAQERVDKANIAVENTQRTRDDAVRRLDEVEERRAATRTELDEARTSFIEYDTSIRAITTAEDPRAERDQLRDRLEAGEKSRDTARTMLADAELEHARNTQSVDDLDRQANTVATELTERRESTETRVVEAGFTDATEAETAFLSATDRDELWRRIERFTLRRAKVEEDMAEVGRQLAGREIDDDALMNRERTVRALETKLEATSRRIVTLDTQIADLTTRVERRETLEADLREREKRHAVEQQLAVDLRGDRFQAFLLDEAFEDLVAGASLRLAELEPRYALSWRDNAFWVLDRDNANEARSADTLSGGETFLAALALALELSEQVQKAAGAVSLDSLFIDEGFGTLDLETLDVVTDAIESLHVGGRMVGLITHVGALAERLPARLRVEKGPGGSHVVLERDEGR